ncbi:hypothetical protein Acr_14g0005910 [Actinidia rufa]|uniref:Uncharacterized protein n=1 Tax=Actinidia rufa TaxID=165716 RepID=A0A7J0FQF8_9ERIC|nr:hypothetical protein Acr_14g0005910 [Actinidia rufa]
MSNLWNHLAQFEPTWTCPTDAAAFLTYRDRSRLCHFLMAFPPDYEHIRASLLHCHPLPTVGQALAELRSEETRKKTMVYQYDMPRIWWTPRKRKSKRKGYHSRQTAAAVTDSSGPSPDSSSSTLTAADVETIVTQVLSRTNIHSSALSTTSGSPPSPSPPSPILAIPDASSSSAAPLSVSCPPVRCSTRVRTAPSHLRDYHCYFALSTLHEPHNFREASSNPDW